MLHFLNLLFLWFNKFFTFFMSFLKLGFICLNKLIHFSILQIRLLFLFFFLMIFFNFDLLLFRRLNFFGLVVMRLFSHCFRSIYFSFSKLQTWREFKFSFWILVYFIKSDSYLSIWREINVEDINAGILFMKSEVAKIKLSSHSRMKITIIHK